jgi:hypothetical protein
MYGFDASQEMYEEQLPLCLIHLIAFGKQQPGSGNWRVLQAHHRSLHFLLTRYREPLLCLFYLIL